MSKKASNIGKKRFCLNFSALFFIIIAADLFIVRDLEWLSHFGFGLRFIANYTISTFGIIPLIFLSIFAFKNASKILKICSIALIFIPMMLQGFYFDVYKKFLTPFGFDLMQEDPMMILTTWADNFNLKIFILISLVAILYTFAVRRFANITKRRRAGFVKSTVKTFALSVSFVAAVLFSVLHWYSIYDYHVSTSAFLSMTFDKIITANTSNKKFALTRKSLSQQPTKKIEELPNIIYIVGESQNVNRMSLYGYERETTPNLDFLHKSNLIIAYTNAISVSTKTRLSLPYMLTGLAGPDPHGVFFSMPTILNYAKLAGYRTALISAQDFKWGYLDRLLIDRDVDEFLDASFFTPSADVHKGADDLDVVKEGVLPFVFKDDDRPFFVVYQMDGSHYPYSDHCPPEYKVFLPEEHKNCDNSYDNTIVYGDFVLNHLYLEVFGEFPNTYMFFSPDHGQNLGGVEGRFNDNFSLSVIHNPLIIFPPLEQPHVYDTLMLNKDAPLSNIDIFPTILDIIGLKSEFKLDGYSLFSQIDSNRIRIATDYMPTYHNNPTGAVFFPDLSIADLDLQRMSLHFHDSDRTVRLSEADSSIIKKLYFRLNRENPQRL